MRSPADFTKIIAQETTYSNCNFSEMFCFTEKPAVYKLLSRALSECLASEEQGLSVEKSSHFEKYSKLFHDLGHDLENVWKLNLFSTADWIRKEC